jgi:enoyl-CoA hydratase/carnithine racemase
MSAEQPWVRLEITGQVARVVVSNPPSRNAITSAMCEMLAGVAAAVRASDVRVVVVRGGGDDAFISGADIASLGPDSDAIAGNMLGLHALRDIDVPVIAMINGPCFGGGVAVALDADIRIASSAARFAIPAGRLGVGYGIAETSQLVGAVGSSNAAQLLFTGSPVDASTALRIGLVDEVVEHDALEEHVRNLAEQISGNAPLSVRAAKQAIRLAVEGGDQAAHDRARVLIEKCAHSADLAEGRAAFLAKRRPMFTGN